MDVDACAKHPPRPVQSQLDALCRCATIPRQGGNTTDSERNRVVGAFGGFSASNGIASFIVPPISLDSSLANVPGSNGEEALNVSEIGRAGPGQQPRKVGRWSARRKAEVVLRLEIVPIRIAWSTLTTTLN